MALIEINRNPSKRDLMIFGVALVVFAGLLGLVAQARWHAPAAARAIWGVGAAVAAFFFAAPPLRRPIYLGWIYLTYPIGFVVSHVVLAIVFYGVMTPIGLALRLSGRDPLARKFEPERTSYWIPVDPPGDPERYFRQF
jgi:ABC-type uncharacterized transport system permease subunit